MKKKLNITRDDFYAIAFSLMLFIAFVVVVVCCLIPEKEKPVPCGMAVMGYACTQDYAEWLKYRIRYDVFKTPKPDIRVMYEY